MSSEKSTEPRELIVAYGVRIIQKSGYSIYYTYVTKFETVYDKEREIYFLEIKGEILDYFDMPKVVYDKHIIQNLLYMAVEQFADINRQL